jgi:hypothetical protein
VGKGEFKEEDGNGGSLGERAIRECMGGKSGKLLEELPSKKPLSTGIKKSTSKKPRSRCEAVGLQRNKIILVWHLNRRFSVKVFMVLSPSVCWVLQLFWLCP